VRTLVNEMKETGEYSIPWLGNNDFGKQVASGEYFIRPVAGSMRKTQNTVLLI
jgi:hypothetical protein